MASRRRPGAKERQKRLNAILGMMKTEAKPFEDVSPSASRKRRAECEADFGLWCRTYLPHYFSTPLAPFHRELAALTEIRGRPVCGIAPRGHGKTTTMKAKVLKEVVTKGRRFIVWIGANGDMAEENTSAIKMELEENARIRADYGDLSAKGGGTWADGQFKTTNGVLILARGRGAGIRGVSNGEIRPDLVIIDDLEDDEQAANPRRVKKALTYVRRTVIPAMAAGMDWSLFWVGTILERRCAIDTVWRNKDGAFDAWERRFFKAIKDDGTALCPEIHSLEDLQALKAIIGALAFNAEMMNDPQDPNGAFREEWLTEYDPQVMAPELTRGLTVMFIDPSVKASRLHDYKSIIVVTLHPSSRDWYVRGAWVRHATIPAMIGAAYDLCERYDVQQVGLEAVGFSELLFDHFDAEAKARGKHLHIVPIGQSIKKEYRIASLSPLHERGKVHYPKGWPGDLSVLKEQLLAWPSSTIHDDGPDGLEGAIRLAEAVTTRIEYTPLGSGRMRRRKSGRTYQHRGTRGGF